MFTTFILPFFNFTLHSVVVAVVRPLPVDIFRFVIRVWITHMLHKIQWFFFFWNFTCLFLWKILTFIFIVLKRFLYRKHFTTIHCIYGVHPPITIQSWSKSFQPHRPQILCSNNRETDSKHARLQQFNRVWTMGITRYSSVQSRLLLHVLQRNRTENTSLSFKGYGSNTVTKNTVRVYFFY